MEKDSGKIFRELKEDVSTYVELKLELLKLSTYERSGQLIAVLSYGLILLFRFLCHPVHIPGTRVLHGRRFRFDGNRVCFRSSAVSSPDRTHYNEQTKNLQHRSQRCDCSIKR